ncbi:MAG: alcohol dehydrogenase catalytic domain-containing protein [Deltaproteobacteria bacterium]|nr:alcohol dehydrogenase catalytic domain-containing protein [Deltaproteobacteria bacterium]
MKALILKKVGLYKLDNAPQPRPGPDEVVIEVKIAGFCSTDLKVLKYGHRDLVLPCIPGEEVVGKVVEKGSDVEEIELGDRVYIYPGTSCRVCKNCIKGAENLCERMQIMGFHRPGGFAEYVLSPQASVIKIPDTISFEEAVFAEPLSCCLNAIELSGLKSGESVGIWGAGPVGNLLKRVALALGAYPTIIEPYAPRMAFANGIDNPAGLTFDVCFVAVGSPSAYREALNCLTARGRLVIFSGLLNDQKYIEIDFNTIHYKEQSVVGSYGSCLRHAVRALQLIEDKAVIVEDLITHRFSLDEIEKAIQVVEERKGMKVLIYPNSG